ncbi:MbtH family protein [Streptomyces sp. NPDC001858]
MPDNTEEHYAVVVNDEEQYSIWPAALSLPAGWRAEGTRGPKQRCLDRIEEVWTDMRPKSVRESASRGRGISAGAASQ